jgi:hypothetical protein
MSDCELVDIIYYSTGYLMIVKFRSKGTDWYAPVPCTRAQIEANLKGQKALALEPDSADFLDWSKIRRIFILILVLGALILIFWKGVAITLGIAVGVAAMLGGGKS